MLRAHRRSKHRMTHLKSHSTQLPPARWAQHSLRQPVEVLGCEETHGAKCCHLNNVWSSLGMPWRNVGGNWGIAPLILNIGSGGDWSASRLACYSRVGDWRLGVSHSRPGHFSAAISRPGTQVIKPSAVQPAELLLSLLGIGGIAIN